jgi:hypothetical protein
MWRADLNQTGVLQGLYNVSCDDLGVKDLGTCSAWQQSKQTASGCRTLQRSDGPWFDSGWPDIFCLVLAHAEPSALLLQSYSRRVLNKTEIFLAAFKNAVDTPETEPTANRMLSGCDTNTPCAPFTS